LEPDIRIQALWQQGALDDALRLQPDHGVLRHLRQLPPLTDAMRCAGDLCDGPLMTAVSTWSSVQPELCATALLAHGDTSAAEKLTPWHPETLAIKALLARQSGALDQARLLEQQLASSDFDHEDLRAWFPHHIVPALGLIFDGKTDAARTFLRQRATDTHVAFAQRVQFFARYLLGQVTDEQFLAQPCRADAKILLPLARGLRAELENQPAVAATAYRDYTVRPARERAINREPLPAATLEVLTRWRLSTLK
jgi:hypothetical protein